MKRSLKAILTVLFTILLSASLFAFNNENHKGDNKTANTVYENTSRSGPVYSDEQWKGTIDITGDVTIYEAVTVTIEPGTTIRFAAGSDDQKEGGDTPISDSYFPNDPAIPPSKISSINLYGGTLYAVGTDDNKIVFTSSASSPEMGDWHSIAYGDKGSNLILQHTIIEYGYYGIQINTAADDSNITIKDNIIRHVVACGICGGIEPSRLVTITVSGNDISDCGHEAIDTHSNATLIIENNTIHDNLWSYGDGAAGVGVVVEGNTSTIRNNQFIKNRSGIEIHSEDSDPDIYCNSFVDNERDIFYSYNGYLPTPTCISPIPSPIPSPTPTSPPSGSITINSDASYTNSTTVTLNLLATDTVGVTGYYLSESSATPSASDSGWTSVTSTTGYSATVSYSLSGGEGSKTIYVWYKDAAGNVSSAASATITLDTTVPTVTISSPTSDSTYTTTNSTISLGGSASDSASGISSVTWSNDRGGNGTATGTARWTVSGISLSSGDDVITVTAKDVAGNSATDTLQVTYSTGTTVSAPTVSTGSATNVTTSSAMLNGTVNANSGTATAWFNYGLTSGSHTGTSTTQSVTGSSNTTISIGISGLSSNTKYYYRIAASYSGGTLYGRESSFTTATATPTPSPTAQPSPSPVQKGIVFGFVNDEDAHALEGVTVKIERIDEFTDITETDEYGYYEFRGLSEGNCTITYEKEGYETQTQDISLEQSEVKDLGVVTMEQIEKGGFYGYVVNIKGDPIEFVRLKLRGIKTKVIKTASSNADGFFEFTDLDADTYTITAKKKGYTKSKLKVNLYEKESKEVHIKIKKNVSAQSKINTTKKIPLLVPFNKFDHQM